MGGRSLAAGDLFDDDYHDCPAKVRLRRGEIDGLTVTRDPKEDDHVNVVWTVTDAATWGLGSNSWNTALVLLLRDGVKTHPPATLALGETRHTFEGVARGTDVKVQLAIVHNHAAGKYLLSDIREARIRASIGKPSFSTAWYTDADGFERIDAKGAKSGNEGKVEEIKGSAMYYIGYNENFANYLIATDTPTTPATPRFRVGLKHAGDIDDDDKFDAYVLRLEDGSGDVLPGGHDVDTVPSDYGTTTFKILIVDRGTGPNTIFIKNTYIKGNHYASYDNLFLDPEQRTLIPEHHSDNALIIRFAEKPTTSFSNVRISDNGNIEPAIYAENSPHELRKMASTESGKTPVTVSPYLGNNPVGRTSCINCKLTPVAVGMPISAWAVGLPEGWGVHANEKVEQKFEHTAYATAPDHHRDFPTGVVRSDETLVIKAWAVNEDREIISPEASITIRPVFTELDLKGSEKFLHYNKTQDAGGEVDRWQAQNVSAGKAIIAEFTVIK